MDLHNKKILFLGKILNFTQEEIEKFLSKIGSKAFFEYSNQDIDIVVISSILTPKEEEISAKLYQEGKKEITLEKFENYFVKSLKPKSLIMALQLSNNQDRLKRLINVEAFDTQTYLKLLKLYNWGNEGIFDSNDNRDVALSLIKRFYPKRENFNHHDIVHSPATILEIALTTTNSTLLDILAKLPNFEINARKQEAWKPKELKEFIAINPNISKDLIDSFLNLKSERLDTILAYNIAISKEAQEIIYNRASFDAKLNLAQNENLDIEIFKKLLNEDEKIVKTLLKTKKIDSEMLDYIKQNYPNYLIFIAKNPNIFDIKRKLLSISKELDFALSTNSALNSNELKELFNKYGNEIAKYISQNPNTPKDILQKLYKLDDFEITLNLASNPNTPDDILDELFNKDNREINKALALNPSLKDEYLDYFKLDGELLRIMSKNPKFLQKVSKKEYI